MGILACTAQFKLYDLTDGRIVSTAIVDTMGNGHGALTGFLKVMAPSMHSSAAALAQVRALHWRRPELDSIQAAGSADEAVHAFGRDTSISTRSRLQPP